MIYSTSLKLTAKYIAKDKNNEVYLYHEKPELDKKLGVWFSEEGSCDTLAFIVPNFLNQLD